ncbi:MAG: zinc-ribbon and DUF3426 domain-containing protein, partial [Pseudomonadota bacterium]|nr:zinc-ribbon and DUF3426 domain-containing protein [Pseudomonadota bacterium]
MTHHVICPGCATVFRVTPSQMSMRDGQLRCGRCQTVFNGWHHLEGPVSEPGQDEASPEIVQNQFIRSTRNNDEQGERLQRDSPSSGDPLPEILRPRQPLGYLRGFWLLIVFIALAALVIQGALFWREQLVARFPVIRPVLANLCTLDGVRLELPHVASLISLDSSELRTD